MDAFVDSNNSKIIEFDGKTHIGVMGAGVVYYYSFIEDQREWMSLTLKDR